VGKWEAREPKPFITLAEGSMLVKAGEPGSWEDAQKKWATQDAGESISDRADQRKAESNARIMQRMQERRAANA
jgi:hypothetical protein